LNIPAVFQKHIANNNMVPACWL